MSACSKHGALEVVDEDLLQILPGVDGVFLKAFKPGEWCGLQCYWEVYDTSMAVE
jgi:hypothetical protein